MIYTESVTILSNAGGVPPETPHMELPALTHAQENKESSTYSQQERASDRLGNAAPVWRSYACACCEYVEASLFFWVGVWGSSPPWGEVARGTAPSIRQYSD